MLTKVAEEWAAGHPHGLIDGVKGIQSLLTNRWSRLLPLGGEKLENTAEYIRWGSVWLGMNTLFFPFDE